MGDKNCKVTCKKLNLLNFYFGYTKTVSIHLKKLNYAVAKLQFHQQERTKD